MADRMTVNGKNPAEATELDYFVWTAERRATETRESLIRDARRLAERMNELADRLTIDPTYGVNGLGEIQGRGMDIDRLCAELEIRRSVLKELRFAIRRDAADAAAEDAS